MSEGLEKNRSSMQRPRGPIALRPDQFEIEQPDEPIDSIHPDTIPEMVVHPEVDQDIDRSRLRILIERNLDTMPALESLVLRLKYNVGNERPMSLASVLQYVRKDAERMQRAEEIAATGVSEVIPQNTIDWDARAFDTAILQVLGKSRGDEREFTLRQIDQIFGGHGRAQSYLQKGLRRLRNWSRANDFAAFRDNPTERPPQSP